MSILTTSDTVFPKIDALHSHCQLSVALEKTSCMQAFNLMKDDAMMWTPEPSGKGSYSIWHAIEEESIWAVKEEAAWPHWKYDNLFEFIGDPDDFQVKGCTIRATSRAQAISATDLSHGNYCSLWNLLNEVESKYEGNPYLEVSRVDASDCKWAPKDPVATCAKQ